MLNVKAADDPEAVLQALWPRLQALAVEPARDEADYVERSAFQLVAFEAQYRVRLSGLKPDFVVPGWDEHFVALVRENSRAANARAAGATVEAQLERRRRELFAQGADLAVLPKAPVAPLTPTVFGGPVFRAPVANGDKCSRLSVILARFLDWREGEDGDRSVANDIAPIVQFAVDLWRDPLLEEVGPDQIVQLKQAMPEIPTTEGLPADKRSLFQRWSIAKECSYVLVNSEGRSIKLTRVSESTLRKRYRTGLNTFWKFLIDNGYVAGPAPDFSSSSKKNPPPVERDAFQEDELVAFLSRPLFTGCESISRTWRAGQFFCQTFFYWAVLIQLLCGMRPGEISQLRCVDVAPLYDKWHFRFAKRSLLEGDGDDGEDEADTAPGGNDAKTRNAFRWIPVYPLLIELGLLRQRDAIIDYYLARKFSEAGGKDRLTAADITRLTDEAKQQWLFPDWKVYVLPTGEIRWSQAASKVWQYVKSKFKMTRQGLALYSARHTFKGFIDDVKDLSDRSRRIVMGHAPAVDTPGGYGPKSITEEQADVILQLSNRTIDRMSAILLEAKRRADNGELKVVHAWRNDERIGDARLQDALEERAKQYR